MLSTELEYLCTELECCLQCWNAFDRVGIPLYRVGMPSRGWECFQQGWNTFVQSWNAFDRVEIPLDRVAMLSRGWGCFLKVWNGF
jgi:hypothetical protein